MEAHTIFGDKVKIYKRDRSAYWQCSASLKGHRHRTSTKEESLKLAKEFAEDWYLELRAKARMGLLESPKEKCFWQVAEKFLEEYQVITEGQRSKKWIESHAIRLRLHLNPYFGDMPISKISAGIVQDYRVQRMQSAGQKNPQALDNRPPSKKPPAAKTIHNEIVTLNLVLKTANRYGWLEHLPDLSAPYKSKTKVERRPWFSPSEYKQLYQATRKYTQDALPKDRWNAEQVHDFVLFMANTGLRPDEARNLQHRDIEIVEDEDTGETILVIEVRGKRGFGYCKSMPGAVLPYNRYGLSVPLKSQIEHDCTL